MGLKHVAVTESNIVQMGNEKYRIIEMNRAMLPYEIQYQDEWGCWWKTYIFETEEEAKAYLKKTVMQYDKEQKIKRIVCLEGFLDV